ncbi:MAG: glycoside hydrolase family 5 protein [Prevotellaceae bacterium]|jgi:endoglucanase|nr:glycoside hydrolase family 5 protein [Prevotellaceae bacterium]
MKHTIHCSLLICLAALLSCNRSSSGNASQTVAEKHGQLSVRGAALVDKNGAPVVLRGVSFGWHNWWPRFYAKETVAWLASDWNATLLRAAIGVEPDGAYLSDSAQAMKCLTAVVDAAIELGVYVIIDWHAHYIHTDKAKAFFAQVAGKYKDAPNVIYEIFNEPWDDMPWSEVKAYSEAVIQTIRAIDKDNIILVGSPHWDQDVHVVADDPITGYDNIMYTLHFYAASHKQWLRDRADYALGKNLPIFVSECAGMESSGDAAINLDEWRRYLQWMQQNNLSWVAWSISDKDETCSMVASPASPASGWQDSDLKAWGKIVKQTLNQ